MSHFRVKDLASNRTAASGTYWPTVEATCAEWFECEESELGIVETDDGDRLSVRGEIVASIQEIC